MNSFRDYALADKLFQNLQAMGFETPTPIQAKVIPAALHESKDIIGCAQTGTGKTGAFLVPMVHQLLNDPEAKGLVLVPTRELAMQIHDVAKELTKGTQGIGISLLIGGSPMPAQLRMLRKNPRIVVATPGRLMDHLRRKTIHLLDVRSLVLDEADRMLDMGFEPQLKEIRSHLPLERRTMMFTATMPRNIVALAKHYLRDPLIFQEGHGSAPAPKIDQVAVNLRPEEKNIRLLSEIEVRGGSMIVFARTQVRTEQLAKFLAVSGVAVGKIHGGRTQGQRRQAIEGFRDGRFKVLVATDVAARGLDIDHIQTVVNYDLPLVAEDYVHRIGRTGRAGATGSALSFVTSAEANLWRAIQYLMDPNAKKRDFVPSGARFGGRPGAGRTGSGRPGGSARPAGRGRPGGRNGSGNRRPSDNRADKSRKSAGLITPKFS